MPPIYKAITAALALTGCVSLIVSGELNPVFVMPGVALFVGYYRHFRGFGAAPPWVIGGLSVAALLVLSFEILFISDDFLVAVAHMTITFQAIKSFDLREPWDPLQVYFMSLLQLIISSELALSMVFAGVFVAFLVTLIVAMVFTHFLKEGTLYKVRLTRPLMFVTLFVFVSTVLLFVAVPRVKSGFFGRKLTRGIRSVGFSDRVDLGSFGNVLLDPTIVMRVEVSGRRLPLYWRGVTLDYFDGVSWKDTMKGRERIFRRRGRFLIGPEGYGEDVPYSIQKVTAEPMDTNVLFGLGEMNVIESPGYILYRDNAGSLFLNAKSYRRLSYTVHSLPESGRALMNKRRYMQVPAGMEWMEEVLGGLLEDDMGDLEMAVRVELWLRENFKYSLRTAPPPPGTTPLEDFLSNSRTGFCEHFASAMVMMLRAAGVPARIVTGFHGGEENSYGDYIIVRQSNAHSWVEASIDGRWRRFDPTPLVLQEKSPLSSLYLDSIRMSWYRYVIGFSRSDQFDILRAMHRPLISTPRISGIKVEVRPVYISVLFVALAFVAVRFMPRGALKRFMRRPPETALYLKFRGRVRRMGGRVGESTTASELMDEAVNLSFQKDLVAAFLRMYEEARFGGRGMDGRMKEFYGKLTRKSPKIG
jgi:transglutaminase-like putative cysteine protease